MKKYLYLSLIVATGLAHAKTQPPLQDVFVTDSPSLKAQQFVVKNGDYQVCKQKAGARTFVMNETCLWEMPIEKDQLMHPHSVAGLKVEKAETESVAQYLQREMGDYGVSVLRVNERQDSLVIYYELDQNELVAR